jgi:putative drug exporter of the RND superfamily
VAMLVLALADFNATREMGPVLALGVATMVVAGLTLLPAILAVLGRRAFWPAVPRVESETARTWRRVGRLVRSHPLATAAVVGLVLVAGALGSLGGREPLGFTDAFREPPESVRGAQLIGQRFIPGRAAPLEVVTDFEGKEQVVAALTAGRETPVQESYVMAGSVPPDSQAGPEGSELALVEAYLRLDPFSDAAIDAVPELRELAPDALIGGETAEAYDTRQALARDTRVIVPVTLALVFLILALLLRALVMPLYLIGTVLLSFAFALGISSLILTHVMNQPASDPGLPVFAFIFLVALGADYNVFLVARIREERARRDTAGAVTTALERTGGVITSAGLVLAATFSVLMALPLESLFQVGLVIALGVLADTFLVRALLVPSIAVLLAERNWWPSSPRLLSDVSTERLDKPTKAA